MNLTIANISTQVSAADLQAAVSAIGRQVAQHFQPEWGVTATLKGVALSLAGRPAPIDGQHDAILYLGDSAEDPTTGVENALGYHATNHADVPYGFVYLDICQKYGENWTTTLSHEVLELVADPNATMTVAGPSPRGSHSHVHYDLEVCDPTQGDTYQIDGITVSNFVGKAYFRLTGGSGRTDYLDLALAPFGVRPAGYLQYEDGRGAHQIYGQKVTEAQKAAKKLMKMGRRNARRAERRAGAV
jgi:hypothetical protein